ncbi:hypothetical protein [Citrobacter portucalensis]
MGISNEVTLLLYCSQIISSHRLNSCTVPAKIKSPAAAPVRTPSGRLLLHPFALPLVACAAALPPELEFCLMARCRLSLMAGDILPYVKATAEEAR